jgi:hypothetical protein
LALGAWRAKTSLGCRSAPCKFTRPKRRDCRRKHIYLNSVGSDECAPRPCTPPAQPQGQRARQRRGRPSTRRFQRTTSKSAECDIAACARISGLSADFRRADGAASARSTPAPKECASADSVGIFWRRATFQGGRGR